MAPTPPVASREGIIVREVGSEVVALDTVEGRVHQLNATASLIWHSTTGGLSEPEIADSLTSTYEVERAAALKDVVTTVTHLRSIGLLPALRAE